MIDQEYREINPLSYDMVMSEQPLVVRMRHCSVAPGFYAMERLVREVCGKKKYRDLVAIEDSSFPIVVKPYESGLIRELCEKISRLGPNDFVYYTAGKKGFLEEETAAEEGNIYREALEIFLARHDRATSYLVLHSDPPTLPFVAEDTNVRPQSGPWLLPAVRRAISTRLLTLENAGQIVLPPGFRAAVSELPNAQRKKLLHSVNLFHQPLVGAAMMNGIKTLMLQILDSSTGALVQQQLWDKTNVAFVVGITDDGHLLIYAITPSTLQRSGKVHAQRDACLRACAVPVTLYGQIQCTMVVGFGFLRALWSMAPHVLYLNCAKDEAALQKAGNGMALVCALGMDEYGHFYAPDFRANKVLYKGPEGEVPIYPEVNEKRVFRPLAEVFNASVLPALCRQLSGLCDAENIFLIGDVPHYLKSAVQSSIKNPGTKVWDSRAYDHTLRASCTIDAGG